MWRVLCIKCIIMMPINYSKRIFNISYKVHGDKVASWKKSITLLCEVPNTFIEDQSVLELFTFRKSKFSPRYCAWNDGPPLIFILWFFTDWNFIFVLHCISDHVEGCLFRQAFLQSEIGGEKGFGFFCNK